MDSLQERAEQHLRFIRQAMQRGVSFTAIPGVAGMIMGGSALAAALLAWRTGSDRSWLTVWLGEAALAVLIGGGGVVWKARRFAIDLRGPAARRFAFGLVPSIVTGAVLTAALAGAGMYRILPALWMLLYGAAALAAGPFTVRPVSAMGVAFMVFGATSLLTPWPWSNLLLAVGFGGLHLGFGAWIASRYGG